MKWQRKICHFNPYPSEMSKKSIKKIVNDYIELKSISGFAPFSILQKSHLAVNFKFVTRKMKNDVFSCSYACPFCTWVVSPSARTCEMQSLDIVRIVFSTFFVYLKYVLFVYSDRCEDSWEQFFYQRVLGAGIRSMQYNATRDQYEQMIKICSVFILCTLEKGCSKHRMVILGSIFLSLISTASNRMIISLHFVFIFSLGYLLGLTFFTFAFCIRCCVIVWYWMNGIIRWSGSSQTWQNFNIVPRRLLGVNGCALFFPK